MLINLLTVCRDARQIILYCSVWSVGKFWCTCGKRYGKKLDMDVSEIAGEKYSWLRYISEQQESDQLFSSLLWPSCDHAHLQFPQSETEARSLKSRLFPLLQVAYFPFVPVRLLVAVILWKMRFSGLRSCICCKINKQKHPAGRKVGV